MNTILRTAALALAILALAACDDNAAVEAEAVAEAKKAEQDAVIAESLRYKDPREGFTPRPLGFPGSNPPPAEPAPRVAPDDKNAAD